MKKITYGFALSALLLAGCSQEENAVMPQEGETITVNYTVTVGKQTRADGDTYVPTMGDGTKVNKLHCAIYEQTGGTTDAPTYSYIKSDVVGVAETGGTAFNYNPVLLKDHTYRIVFWAMHYDGETAAYTANAELTEIKLPTTPTGNNDNFDAFVGTDIVTVPSGEATKSVTLARPFGQLNFLTTEEDLANALALVPNITEQDKAAVTSTVSVTMSALPTSYNAFTGQVTTSQSSTTAQTYTFSATTCPGEKMTIGETEYISLATNYLLPAETATCVLKLYAGEKEVNSLTVQQVPFKANQRTNIYGQLLTGQQNYTVTVGAGFTEQDENKTVE